MSKSRKAILDRKKARVIQTTVYDTTGTGIDITIKKDGEPDEHMSGLQTVIRKTDDKKTVTDLDVETKDFQKTVAKSRLKMKRNRNAKRK